MESDLAGVWQALRAAHLETLAPVVLQVGIRSCNCFAVKASELLAAGVPQSQIEAVLEQIGPKPVVSKQSQRADFPALSQWAGKASFMLAVQAGHPNNRKRSLEALDADILAKSTNPSVLSRLRTWKALAATWEIPPWPLHVETVRCIGASLKAGGYRSAALYFSTAVQHQLRELGEPVAPVVHHAIKDTIRSITRGLGPGSLKDVFPFQALETIPLGSLDEPFNMHCPGHFRDLMVVGSFFMLREIELSSSKAQFLSLDGSQVTLTIPVRKTNAQGSLEYRSLSCACKAQELSLCPWHAAERHLVRLSLRPDFFSALTCPLCPNDDGRAPSKAEVISVIRSTLKSAGVETTRTDHEGNIHERFGGHSLRVAGASFLSSAGVEKGQIQLLGRWTSTAIERYTQDAGLMVTPTIPSRVLGGDSAGRLEPPLISTQTPATPQFSTSVAPRTPSRSAAAQPPPPQNKMVQDLQSAHHSLTQLVTQLSSDVSALKQSVPATDQVLVVRCRSRVVHLGACDEVLNNPEAWRTRCGWNYGLARFMRVPAISHPLRACKKCHGHEGSSDSEGSVASNDDSGSSTLSSCSDDP
eukprot:Skav217461  [mRNA]  locus=scaffold1405:68992:70746:+ [translate_table: standard]